MIWHQHKPERSLEEEKVPSFPFRTFQYLKRTYMKAGERFLQGCVVIEQEGMASNWIWLDIGMKFFTVSVARYWHELPKEAVAALSLKELKVRMDGALTTLIVRVSLPKAGAWNWMILWPFPAQAILWFFWFCDFMVSPDYLKMLPKDVLKSQCHFCFPVSFLHSGYLHECLSLGLMSGFPPSSVTLLELTPCTVFTSVL